MLREDDTVAGDGAAAHMKSRRGTLAKTASQAHRAVVGDVWGIYTESFLRMHSMPWTRVRSDAGRLRSACVENGTLAVMSSETRQNHGLVTGTHTRKHTLPKLTLQMHSPTVLVTTHVDAR